MVYLAGSKLAQHDGLQLVCSNPRQFSMLISTGLQAILSVHLKLVKGKTV